ncbi:MAG: hypothetical protein H6686_07335 [Fibrobacteria bacterium]|nr:hypothetical protein [Fibrobacteria bacterium]
MRLDPVRRPRTASLLASLTPLLLGDSWDDLIVGMLRATAEWLGADRIRFWQVDATVGGLSSRWSFEEGGIHQDVPPQLRGFPTHGGDPALARWGEIPEGWSLTLSCRARRGEVGLLEIEGSVERPDPGLVEQWGELVGGCLVRGRESMRERRQAGGLRRFGSIARELSSCPDEDSFWKRVIEIPRERFGIERCAALIPQSPPSGVLRGTWGTDLGGRSQREDSQTIEVPTLEAAAGRSLDRITGWVVLDRDPRPSSLEESGVVPGKAALVPVPGSPDGPAWLLVDQALTGTDLEAVLLDLMVAYGILVGQVAGRRRLEEALSGMMADAEVSPRLSELLDAWGEDSVVGDR